MIKINFECCQECGIIFNLEYVKTPKTCPNCKTQIISTRAVIKRNGELLRANEIVIAKNIELLKQIKEGKK